MLKAALQQMCNQLERPGSFQQIIATGVPKS
jgi:hypothetical protein